MNIIAKRADQLKPGDIIRTIGGVRRVVTYIAPPSRPGAGSFVAVTLESRDITASIVTMGDAKSDTLFDVEDYALTPAQQNADVLLTVLRGARDFYDRHAADGAPMPSWVVAGREVIDTIDPKPPTAGELAQALADIIASWDSNGKIDYKQPYLDAQCIVKRARATGVLK